MERGVALERCNSVRGNAEEVHRGGLWLMCVIQACTVLTMDLGLKGDERHVGRVDEGGGLLEHRRCR